MRSTFCEMNLNYGSWLVDINKRELCKEEKNILSSSNMREHDGGVREGRKYPWSKDHEQSAYKNVSGDDYFQSPADCRESEENIEGDYEQSALEGIINILAIEDGRLKKAGKTVADQMISKIRRNESSEETFLKGFRYFGS